MDRKKEEKSWFTIGRVYLFTYSRLELPKEEEEEDDEYNRKEKRKRKRETFAFRVPVRPCVYTAVSTPAKKKSPLSISTAYRLFC